ncbi:MAG TPA: histidinol-phosphate transaminase [Vicinamibacterales bacterium]|nr:histidinol-phosphate transaminase [Vicinamibacterales bacterium]
MSLSRRSFIRTLGAGGAGFVSASVVAARGSEAWGATGSQAAAPGTPSLIRLDSNENPAGPGTRALNAMRGAFAESSLYPHRAGTALPEAIARFHGVPADHVLATCGSVEVLRMVVEAFASPSRPLVTALPTYESCTRTARFLEYALHEVPVDASLSLDLKAMGERAAGGAGIVFLCNPNNPTGTVHGEGRIADFLRASMKASPDTVILVDEAYDEYVEDPRYRTAIPLALEHPQVLVCRTFSKVHGLAGMRVGYVMGKPETLKRLAGWRLGNGLNMLGIRAAIAALEDRDHIERSRAANRAGRELLRRFFHDRGFKVADSHANFVLADIRRDAAAFQKACRAEGVAVGRPFPPLNSWTRVSVGTPDENRQALDVFSRVLANT